MSRHVNVDKNKFKMKSHLLYLIILFSICEVVSSQGNCIKVTYKIQRNSSSKTNDSSKQVEIKEGINKNITNLEYQLYCYSNESLFFLEEKMEFEDDFYYKIARILGGEGLYYKNTNDKIKFKLKDVSGIKFNIINNFIEYNWEITKETKFINGYLCYKASSKFEEYDYLRKRNNSFSPEVWFTPEISYPFGPKGFDGLPGLVLEASLDGKTIFYATKIDFSSSDCERILKKPKGGKDISKDDFLKLIAEKSLKS